MDPNFLANGIRNGFSTLLLILALVGLAALALVLLDHLRWLQKRKVKAHADLAEAERLLEHANANLPNARRALLATKWLKDINPVAYLELLQELEIYEECRDECGHCWPALRTDLARMRRHLESLPWDEMLSPAKRAELDELLQKAEHAATLEKDIREEDREVGPKPADP